MSAAETVEWSARVRFSEELGHSFDVLIFLGPVDEDPVKWRTSASFVGKVSCFTRSGRPRRRDGPKIEGHVPLTDALAGRAGLPTLCDPAVVTPYLRRELSWRVYAGSDVPLTELPSLEVTVQSVRVTQTGEVFPVVGDPVLHRDVTRGRQGGDSGESPTTTTFA